MTTRYYLLGGALILIAFALALVYYPQLPDRIPIHWDADGVANGYGPRATIFMWPALMAGLLVLARALPWLSPRAFELDDFPRTYGFIMVTLVAMFGYVHVVTLWALVGGGIDLGRAMLGGLAMFLALVGNVMGKVRRNFWIGIRTPWTLASDKVWYATHRLAARLMVVCSLLCVAGVVAGVPSRWCLTVLLAGPLLPLVYSLLYYKRLERSGQLEHE